MSASKADNTVITVTNITKAKKSDDASEDTEKSGKTKITEETLTEAASKVVEGANPGKKEETPETSDSDSFEKVDHPMEATEEAPSGVSTDEAAEHIETVADKSSQSDKGGCIFQSHKVELITAGLVLLGAITVGVYLARNRSK